jgi:hypothetical protein
VMGDGHHDQVATRRMGQQGVYIPSVLVTTGRLLLLSLGEVILEAWEEVRAVVVVAAIGRGDVADRL